MALANGEGSATAGANTVQFKHLDVVPEASDHYFLRANERKSFDNACYAKIMKEWKILEKNLPESIYVQVFETRIELLRAVIIGAPRTPYHDGLFFFDICLPLDYPQKPPKLYYHSHGHRLNPNLYKNGLVCLSLINTWSGSTTEMWTQNSTILQILVSIQGLVLNEKPFFNEPGYGGHINSKDLKWVTQSNKYNQTAFTLSCNTMCHILRKPPQNFEVFVRQHFRERANMILAAINDYKAGRCAVGQFQASGAPSSAPVSPIFMDDLTKLESSLRKALWTYTGAPVNVENNIKTQKRAGPTNKPKKSTTTEKRPSQGKAQKSTTTEKKPSQGKAQKNVKEKAKAFFSKLLKWLLD